MLYTIALSLLLSCAQLFSTATTAAATTTAAVAMPAEDAARVALDREDYAAFFDELRLKTPDVMVQGLNLLFAKSQFDLGDAFKRRLIATLKNLCDDRFAPDTQKALGKLIVSQEWKAYAVQENDKLGNLFVVAEQERDKSTQMVVADELLDPQATTAVTAISGADQHASADKKIVSIALSNKLKLAACGKKKYLHPFVVCLKMQKILFKQDESGNSNCFYEREDWLSINAMWEVFETRQSTEFRAIVLAGLGYFVPDTATPGSKSTNIARFDAMVKQRFHAPVYQASMGYFEKLSKLSLGIRVENIGEYNKACDAMEQKLKAEFTIISDLLPIIVGYAIPYRVGRSQSDLLCFNGSTGEVLVDSVTEEMTVSKYYSYSHRLVDQIDVTYRNPGLVGAIKLSENLIENVPSGMCRGLSGLRKLYLQDNCITTIDAGAFDEAGKLEILDLSNNLLEDYPVAIEQLPKLRTFLLERNPLTPEAERRYKAFQEVLAARWAAK
jgi:hypothetical protein